MNNAILVKPLGPEKIEIDFSDIQNIYSVLNASRLYTAHTARTNEISQKLGIHIIGFFDENGNDIPNEPAQKITGYDYIGSFLLLCKTDDHYNPLPFTEAELNSVYTYLTTGEVVPTNEGIDFLKKFNIHPFLPNLGVEPQVLIIDDCPNAAAFVYDLREQDLSKLGQNLFNFSSLLVENYIHDQESEDLMDKEGTFFMRNGWSKDRDFFVVLVQAITDKGQKSRAGYLLGALLDVLEESAKEVGEDAVEEVMEQEDDESGLEDYVLFVKLEMKAPSSESIRRRYWECVYPLAYYKDEPIDFPGFDHLIEFEGFDRIHDEATINFVAGDLRENLTLKLDQSVRLSKTVNLDVPATIDATLTFKKIRLIGKKMNGELQFTYQQYQAGRFSMKKLGEPEVAKISEIDASVDTVAHLIGCESYFITGALNEAEDLVIVMVHIDQGSDTVENVYYAALSKNDPEVQFEVERVNSNGSVQLDRTTLFLKQ